MRPSYSGHLLIFFVLIGDILFFTISWVCLEGLKLSFKLSNALLERASHGPFFLQVPTKGTHSSSVLRIFHLVEGTAVSSQVQA